MPIHNFQPPRGELTFIEIESQALAGNLLGDPSKRMIAVYLPQTAGATREIPLFVYLASFTGSGLKKLSWRMFGESIPQRIDRLISEGRIGPVAVAFPDCFTSLGGNQYVNSPAMGRWEDFLLEELIPRLEKEFPIRRDAKGRAVFGFSSGGYGAIVQGLKHGDQWGAVACHSGDMGFEISLRDGFAPALTTIAARGGDVESFLAQFEESRKAAAAEVHALMMLALSASYDPDPAAPKGIRLPVDPHTCRLDPERWRRWLAHDPVEMIQTARCRESLLRLKGLYFDCGRRDQYHLQYGARLFSEQLHSFDIDHRYEEFDDNHSGVDYRLDVSLPFLFEAVS